LIALSAFVGLASISQVGAAQKDEAAAVLTGYQEVLKKREGTAPAILEKVDQLIAEETTDPGALTEILRELHPDFAKALGAAADAKSDAGLELLKQLSESDDPYLAAESSYYLARTLLSRRRHEEALPIFIKIQDDYFDQSLRIGESIFYQGLCESTTLQRDAASISLNDFVDLYPDAPERLLAEANDIIGRIENVLDGSIDDVADHMDFATNKLELVDAGERTQGVQNDIIAMLDELIKQAEDSPP
jgi:TolA-binding protein